MLIYIIHLNNINTFRLPKNFSGSYMLSDLDVDNKSRSLINISSEDDKWYFNSNSDVSIMYNGSYLDKVEVIPYEFYTLNYHNSEYIILYVFPGFIDKPLMKEVANGSSIIVGKGNDCNLVYNNPRISDKQIKLDFNNGVWNLSNLDNKVPIYVNKKREENVILSSFDSVFLMGVKLTFVGNKIFIVGPIENIRTGDILVNTKFELVVADNPITESAKELYTMYDYFYKSPIFKKKYDTYKAVITPPDAKEKNTDSNILSQIVPSALMGLSSFVTLYFSFASYKRNTAGASADTIASNKESLITGIVMFAILLVTSILWPIIEHYAAKLKRFFNNRMRVFNYKRYLKRKDKEFEAVIVEEKNVLKFNNISLNDCEDAIVSKNANLFSRNIESDSFLRFLCGSGRVKSSIEVEYSKPDFIVQNDKLYDDIDALIKKYEFIDDSSFTFSLKNKSLAVIDATGNYSNYLNSILLQLSCLHDYGSLKFVVLTNPNSNLNHIKNLNHCWNNSRTFRFFATNLNEAESVSNELMKIINKVNSSDNKKGIDTYYVIISDCIEYYKSLKIIDYVLRSATDQETMFISLLLFTNKVNNIPTGCNYFINYSDNECTFFNSEMDEKNIVKFKPNKIDTTVNFYRDVERLANIPVKVEPDDTSNASLPSKFGFLEMFGVGKIEQLNIVERWKTAPISSTLATPIGIDANGNILNLDLHEKKHGPHGLIAGMTGSGKSEFIVSYILSLAINYSPDEVQFVLIDYKGGGLAGAFENRKTGIKLPHLVGTITNLDKAEMNRTLVSIKSELQRRQKAFNAAKEKLNTGSIDIYKYQMYVRDGSLDEPMSHLFIICDEFAELKAQQPDFMDELVSAARIGRSLGIHLILATQKPSGVVDDQIWSNAKFKVCCKVQTADDSNEMLRKPDAAYIKEAGRFYLQVGYDEYYVLGQSGYSGIPYVPSEMVTTNTDDSIYFIDDTGDTYRNVVKKDNNVQVSQDLGEELTNVMKYIVDVAEVQGYKNHQLWLDNVPKRLFYGNLLNKYTNIPESKYVINPLIGEYDDPENQRQGFVRLSLTGAGNTVIMGNPGSGKATLFSTMIFSSIIRHTSDELNIYILDFGTVQFINYKKAPHIGDVLSIDDKNKISYFFYMIETELNKRKKYYSEHGGDYQTDVSTGNCAFPNIIVYMYGFEVFKENFDELFDDLFVPILRNCSKFGIEFVIAVSSPDGVPSSVDNSFKQYVLLQLSDESTYSYIFKGGKAPAGNPGRGVILNEGVPVEYQTALICEESSKKEYLDSLFTELDKSNPIKAPEVPDVPRKLSIESYTSKANTLNNIPLGVNLVTAQQQYFDFNKKISLLAAAEVANIGKFVSYFSKIICSCENTNLIILNGKKGINYKLDEKAKIYESDFEKVNNLLYDNCLKLNENPSEKSFVILVLGYSAINNYLTKAKAKDDSIHTLDDLILDCSNNNFKFVLFEKEESYSKLLNSNISNLIDNSNGIWIGVDYDSQSALDMQSISYSDNPVNPSNEMVVNVVDSEPLFIRFPTI